MRPWKRENTDARSPWADDYVSEAERAAYGDDEAAVIAQERRNVRLAVHPLPSIDPEEVVSTREELPDEVRITDDTVEVLAHRLHLLSGRPGLPWKDDA